MSLLEWRRLQAQLHYARHFAGLSSAAVCLAITSSWRAPAGANLALASYGALHAACVAGSLRTGCPAWRRLAFIAAAAIACVLAARAGVGAAGLAGRFYSLAPQMALASTSFAGAMAYGLLLRSLLEFRLPMAMVVTASIACVPATLAALAAAGPALGGVWVAAAWWFAFSGCLWCADRHGIQSMSSNREFPA